MKHRALLTHVLLDRNSRESLHAQLTRALRAALAAGDLPAGSPLPSTRALAASLGISRNTVVTAYEELAAEGRIAGRTGSATVVATVRAPRREPDWRALVRSSQYPVVPAGFRDPDCNQLYFHR